MRETMKWQNFPHPTRAELLKDLELARQSLLSYYDKLAHRFKGMEEGLWAGLVEEARTVTAEEARQAYRESENPHQHDMWLVATMLDVLDSEGQEALESWIEAFAGIEVRHDA